MLFKKGVITHLEHEKGEFISPIFVRAKLDEEFCMTLNLKALKKYVEYKKVKMHIISSILVTVTLNMYIAILDIKDAYDSMPTHESNEKLLEFVHDDQVHKFTAMPNGYTEDPRKFTETLITLLAFLTVNWKILVATYIDDLIAMTFLVKLCIK